MLKPPRLRPGDRVAVVAPASPFIRDEFDKGVAELQRLGFEPVFDDSVFAPASATSPERRASGRRRFSRRGAIRWCARSSACAAATAACIYSHISKRKISGRRRKRLSVIATSRRSSHISHGAVGSFPFTDPCWTGDLGAALMRTISDTFLRSLTSTEPLGELCAPALEAFCKGEATGPLIGGTLAQLVASLGTPYAFKPPTGHVLFLEDVAERPYRLDRMLTQLRLAGILDAASALVLGEFLECDEPGGELSARAVLADLLKDFDRAGRVRFSVRPHGRPAGHTAVWRPGARPGE